MSTRAFLALLVPFGLAVTPPVRGGEAVFLARETAGMIAVDDEVGVRVHGVRGALSIRAATPGEMRFAGEALEDPEEPLPVDLWTESGWFEITAPAEETGAPARRLELAVPPSLRVVLDLADSAVDVSSIDGDLELTGRDVAFTGGGLRSDLSLQIEGGSVEIAAVDGDVSLRGSRLGVVMHRVVGRVDLTIEDGEADLEEINGDLEIDATESRITADGVVGFVQLRGQGGTAALEGLARGGEFHLSRTRLSLKRCRGDLDIETDADVSFGGLGASLHVNSWGGSVRGSGNDGLVEVKTEGASVVLENINGPVRVQGESLSVVLRRVREEALVLAVASTVHVEDVSGPLTIENDYGDVTVEKARRKVEVRSRGGDVRVTAAEGPVNVEADGREVLVAWSNLKHQQDSYVRNDSGDVAIHFPSNGGCRVEAQARYGRIETDLPTVRVSDDGSRAQGPVNRRRRPLLRVESVGGVQLLSGSPGEPGS